MDETWIQAITIIAANLASTIAIFGLVVAMFLWLRSEANNDRRDMLNKISENNANTTQMIFDLTNTLISESKQFHEKFGSLNERIKK